MYDVIVVGGGVSGLSAALFTAKSGLTTLVFDEGKPQIKRISKINNLPGLPEGTSGEDWINRAQQQVEDNKGSILNESVVDVKKNEEGIFEVKTEKGQYQAKNLVIATNTNKQILASFYFEEKINAYVPSGKAKSILLDAWNGETGIENLYLAGLLTEIPSQISVALGHGAAVGLTIASKMAGKPYMWHDV